MAETTVHPNNVKTKFKGKPMKEPAGDYVETPPRKRKKPKRDKHAIPGVDAARKRGLISDKQMGKLNDA